MINNLLEALGKFWDELKIFTIVNQYEGGVKLRKGLYCKTLTPGWWWKLPIFESFLTIETVTTTMDTQIQTVSDKIVGAIIRYSISDPKEYLLYVYDTQDVIRDTCMGCIREVVEEVEGVDEAQKKVTQKARRAVKKYGVNIECVTFTDFGKVKTLRLLMEG